MNKVGLPKGLIRFSSQNAIDRKPRKLARARTVIYPLILIVVLSGLAFAVRSKSTFDARILRGKGAPFSIVQAGVVSNSFSLRLVNRTDRDQLYDLQLAVPEGSTLEIIDRDSLQLSPGESVLVPLSLRFPSRVTSGDGNAVAELRVTDDNQDSQVVSFKVLGPR